ncbi:MAG: ATPase [Anaerolineae bacterium]|nr:ATPase [Anaerolineae bacterium]
MPGQYFLGVDIGATKSHALVADGEGHATGFGECGPGSYEAVGWEGLQHALVTITERALQAARITKSDIVGAGFGIAGYDWPGELERHRRAVESLGLSAPYGLVNDTLVGLVAGASQGWGVGVVSGTGCNCWGRDPKGREGHVTGDGDTFGEYAGGGDIVRRAVQDIARAWSMRGPCTRLTDAFVELAGATSDVDLLEGLSMERYTLSAAAAPLVFRIAAEGDSVAQEIIRWAGRELANLAVGVIHQLGCETLDFEVVQIGSVFNGSPLLGETMMTKIHEVAPGARPVRLMEPPVVGGVLLGMEQAGIDYPPLRAGLTQSVARLLPLAQ